MGERRLLPVNRGMSPEQSIMIVCLLASLLIATSIIVIGAWMCTREIGPLRNGLERLEKRSAPSTSPKTAAARLVKELSGVMHPSLTADSERHLDQGSAEKEVLAPHAEDGGIAASGDSGSAFAHGEPSPINEAASDDARGARCA
ncbi:MAG: hypothetical protein ACI835_003623 [Planctomycetota bacterium]|jgi:hypothetical protein